MTTLLTGVLYGALAIHVGLAAVGLWRVVRGENVVDRLVGLELVSVLLLATLVIVSLLTRDSIYIDVAIGLAAVGFVSTIALARYVADEQMF